MGAANELQVDHMRCIYKGVIYENVGLGVNESFDYSRFLMVVREYPRNPPPENSVLSYVLPYNYHLCYAV